MENISFERIKEVSAYISENSDRVTINREKLKKFAASIKPADLSHWMVGAYGVPEQMSLEQELMFAFLFNTTSFCYWPEPQWRRVINGKKLGGSLSLVACYGDAIKSGIDLLAPDVVLSLSLADYKKIMSGDTGAPLIMAKERLAFLQSSLSVIKERYHNSLEEFISSKEADSQKLLTAFVNDFSGYDDFSDYRGEKCPFLKKAQLTISDFNHIYHKHTEKSFENREKLSACADYKLPQILRYFGALDYAPDLAYQVDHKIELAFGSPEEAEIKGNTLHAIELIAQEFNATHSDTPCSSMEINNFIWVMSQGDFPDMQEHHRTMTWFY